MPPHIAPAGPAFDGAGAALVPLSWAGSVPLAGVLAESVGGASAAELAGGVDGEHAIESVAKAKRSRMSVERLFARILARQQCDAYAGLWRR